VDFVVVLGLSDIQQLLVIFPVSDFYVPPEEGIAEELARGWRSHSNIMHEATGFKADFYVAVADELNAWGFQFKREIRFDEETLALVWRPA
jgi:hypothetical protein